LDQYDQRKTTIPKLKLLRRQVEQENKEEEVNESKVNDTGVSTQSCKKRKWWFKQDPDFDYGCQSK
jgi:hypothetical protein